MPRPKTGETPKRNVRVEDEIWQPAMRRAEREAQKLPVVIRNYLARYGAELPDDAPARDPWELVNYVMRDHTAGPDTDLASAAEAAADLLRALGIRPTKGGS